VPGTTRQVASFRPSTYRRRFSEVAMAEGGSPITRAHSTGDWFTRSAVCTSSAPFTRGLLVHVRTRTAALSGTGRVSARRGRAGETSCLFEHPARCSSLGLDVRTIEFLPCLIVFPQPARPRLARRRRWGPDAGAPHVRIGGAGEGNPLFLLHQLSKDAGGRPTPMGWRSTACSSSRLYGLVR